jgi:hypothetical protein
LKTVDLSPTKITRLQAVFVLCTALESVTFPATLEEIGDRTFQRTDNLKSFTIPSHVKRMGNLVFGESGIESITLPATLEYIGSSFFYKCLNLKKVNMSACANLETVPDQRGKGVFTMDGTFHECSALEVVDLSACTKIKETWFLFTNCSNLKTVALPSSIEYIGASSFYGCTALSEFYVTSENPPAFDYENETPFDGIPATCTLYVPPGKKTAYGNANLWKDFYMEERTPPAGLSIGHIAPGTVVAEQDFYSLTGAYLGKTSNTLPRGIYIVKNKYDNGTIRSKKVFIKE